MHRRSKSPERKRIAFVVPRYGADVIGGAEKYCRDIAQRLSSRYDVTVLTTCARTYETWRNELPSGKTVEDRVTVVRFPVRSSRLPWMFDALSRWIKHREKNASHWEQRIWMKLQGPHSPMLLQYLGSHAHEYDRIFFLPYLYATTYFGLPLARERAVLIPLAHDEWMIHLPVWDRWFSQVRKAIYVTEEERAFVSRRFKQQAPPGRVAGVGIEAQAGDAARFRETFGIPKGPFLLYLGRLDRSKGCDDVVKWFRSSDAFASLVLCGPLQMKVTNHPAIVLTGQVSEQQKWDALCACDALVVPSRFESLSYAALEAWSVGRPVIARADCAVLAEHIRENAAGALYLQSESFDAALRTVVAAAPQMGANGRDYVLRNYTWTRALEAFEEIIG